MPLTYRAITSKDLLFVERLIRDGMPAYRIDADQVRRLLGHWPGQRGRLSILTESEDRVGVIGIHGEEGSGETTDLHLIGPFILAARRERLYLPTVIRRELDAARALGAERLIAHRLEGKGASPISSVWPTIGSRAFTAWRGTDLLAEAGFRRVGESEHWLLPATTSAEAGMLPPPYHIRPYDAERDAGAVERVFCAPFGFVEYVPPPILEESALVVVADHQVVGVVGWSAPARELHRLAVLPERQGRGLGRALLTHAIGRLRARGPGAVHVHVDRENARAIALFRSAGFEHVSTYTRFACVLSSAAILP